MLIRMPAELRIERNRLIDEHAKVYGNDASMTDEEYNASSLRYIEQHASPGLLEYIHYSRRAHEAAKELGVKI